MMFRMSHIAFLAACLGVGSAFAQSPSSMATKADEDFVHPVAVARQMGGWTFAPIVAGADARIVAYIAFQSKGERIAGQIDVVWFERQDSRWTASVWVNGGLMDAVAYAHARFDATDNHLAPGAIGEAWAKYRQAPFEPVAPEPLAYGVAQSDPMAELLTSTDDLGEALEALRKGGWAVTPELPAIFARSEALLTGDRQRADEITQNSIIVIGPGGGGPGRDITPIDECGGVVVHAIAMTDATHQNYDSGMQAMLSQIADLDQAMLDSAGQSPELGMFCGCSVLYGDCTGATGGFVFTSSEPSADSRHCRYCRTGLGTRTYTYTGQTFWCCDPCTGGGTESCSECKTCTIQGLGACPAAAPC